MSSPYYSYGSQWLQSSNLPDKTKQEAPGKPGQANGGGLAIVVGVLNFRRDWSNSGGRAPIVALFSGANLPIVDQGDRYNE